MKTASPAKFSITRLALSQLKNSSTSSLSASEFPKFYYLKHTIFHHLTPPCQKEEEKNHPHPLFPHPPPYPSHALLSAFALSLTRALKSIPSRPRKPGHRDPRSLAHTHKHTHIYTLTLSLPLFPPHPHRERSLEGRVAS